MKVLIPLSFLCATATIAQTSMPTEFPADALPLAAAELTERLSEKVLFAKMTDGAEWRYQFKGGYFYLNVSTGYSDDGPWHIDGTKLCVKLRKTAASCSEMRSKGELLFVKRASNGEVATLRLR